MLRQRLINAVVCVAGFSLLLVDLTAPVASAVDKPTPKPVPVLKLGQSVRGGHWTAKLCTPDAFGMIMVPPVGFVDRHAFTLSKAAVVSLTFAVDAASNHPALGALVMKLGKSNPANTFGLPVPVKGRDGKAVMAGINIVDAPPVDADQPTGPTMTVTLTPGTYLTEVTYGYCAGFFTVRLDSVVALPGGTTTPPPVKAVKLNRKNLKLKVGQKFQLRARVAPKAATGAKLTWKSSNSKVVKVSKTGRIKALKKGQTTITVKARTGTKAKVKVKVKPKTKAKAKAKGK